MTILASDLRFFQAERMTDESDGGGRMSGVEIATGNTNGVFDDISDVDRAAGDCSIRKIYATVTSDSADKYLDAGVVVMKPPADPDVSVLMFSTGSFYDEHDDLRNKVESSIVRGPLYSGYLWGDHASGQRAITIWQRVTGELPGVGRRMELVAYSGGSQTHSQTLWLTKMTETEITKYDSQGAFQIRRVICELAEALRGDYLGTEPSRYDPSTTSLGARIYETRYNAGSFPVYGIQPLEEVSETGEYSIKVDSLYAPLIPTAFSETAIPDATPGGDSLSLVAAASGTVSYTTTANVVGANKSLFVGSGVKPGTFSIVIGGTFITDDSNGVLFASGSEYGTMSYSTGVCTFNNSCPSYGTTSKGINFTPAVAPLRVEDTASQIVTVENRGFVWVITLLPIPAPSTLRISYRVNNAWYTINDTGGGQLSGADSSYGSATLDFTTGTVVLQTGELPDVDSEIIYAWGTAVNYESRADMLIAAPVVRGTTANPNVIPGSVVITWPSGTATDYELKDTDKNGKLTGTGGVGSIVYRNGNWLVKPDKLPLMGAEFTINYRFGDPAEKITDTFADLAIDGNGGITFTLSQEPEQGTLSIAVPMETIDYYGGTGETAERLPITDSTVVGQPSELPESPTTEAIGYRIIVDIPVIYFGSSIYFAAKSSSYFSESEVMAKMIALLDVTSVTCTPSVYGSVFTMLGDEYTVTIAMYQDLPYENHNIHTMNVQKSPAYQ